MSKILEMWAGMTGTVLPFALSTAPDGWLICDGSALEPGTADNLRDKLLADGSPYGDDGSGNPLLPDMRGEFIRGLDAGRGVDVGRALGSVQAGEIQEHAHLSPWTQESGSPSLSLESSVLYHDTVGNSGGTAAGFRDLTDSGNPGNNTVNGEVVMSTTSTGGDETRPRNVALNFIIKT